MFECYERNVAAMIGLSTAVQYLSKLGINAIEERTSRLSSSLIAGLSELKDIKVLEKSRHRSSIITFTKGNIDAKILRDELKKRNINVSVCKQQKFSIRPWNGTYRRRYSGFSPLLQHSTGNF